MVSMHVASESDINECETGTDSCDVSAECTNTDGSYTCSCTSGYSGDGMNCSGISVYVVIQHLMAKLHI